MNNLINYLFESGIALGAFTVFYFLVLRQEKSFSFNRFYLIGCTVLSLILPGIHFSLESVPSDLVVSTIFLEEVALNSTQATTDSQSLILWLYGFIAILLIIRLIYKLVPLFTSPLKCEWTEGYRVIYLENSPAAYTFWNTIFLGDQLNKEEQQLILSHEKVHAIEKHSLDILFFEIVSALLWINPTLLIIKKLAKTNHEYLADARAVDQDNKETYIKALATQVIKQNGYELAHAFHSSSTLKRIKMINQQNKQTMKIKQIFPFVLGLALIVVFGCEDAAEQLSEMNDQDAAKVIAQVQTSAVKEAEGMEGVYDQVEVLPDPSGGMTEFYQWVADNMEYPTQARKDGIEGKVFVQFIVDESGQLTEVKSIKGIGAGCDAEAVRVMKSAAKWTPGLVDNKPVKVRMILPISFKLG